MLNALRRAKETKAAARRAYAAVAAQARNPAFFTGLGVADTMDGRFDLVCLHAWLALDRMDGRRNLAQAFVNEVFAGFDEALREGGAGDMGMNRRLKKMANAFYGRLQAYRSAPTQEELAEAIRRNLFRGSTERISAARTIATYACASRSRLNDAEAAHGDLAFAPLLPE